MKRYVPNVSCPKCGEAYWKLKFVPWFSTCLDQTDYILKTCGVCGYYIMVAPMDAKDVEDEN